MRIKKHSNQNEYLLTEDRIWVRNFCKMNVPKIDINNLISSNDYQLLLENEKVIRKNRIPSIDIEHFFSSNIIIVSDGFDFSKKQKILSKLPSEVTIIGVNRSLAKWQLVGSNCPKELKRNMNYFLVNNPYQECTKYIPTQHKYFPKCVISNRTNIGFTQNYRGNQYTYSPVKDEHYFGLYGDTEYKIDDYRNPICAAIGLAYKFRATKILLFCCDDSFENERPGAIQLENGLWTYPQQLISQRTIDANLHWLPEQVKTGNHSCGAKMKNATYISEEDVVRFFEEEEENEVS